MAKLKISISESKNEKLRDCNRLSGVKNNRQCVIISKSREKLPTEFFSETKASDSQDESFLDNQKEISSQQQMVLILIFPNQFSDEVAMCQTKLNEIAMTSNKLASREIKCIKFKIFLTW